MSLFSIDVFVSVILCDANTVWCVIVNGGVPVPICFKHCEIFYSYEVYISCLNIKIV